MPDPCFYLQLDLLQPQQRQNINLQRLDQLLKRGALVRAVHRARKGRDLNVGVLGAEADGIGEVARIGAAAHRKGLLALAGDVVVGVDERLDGRTVRVDVERHAAADVLQRGRAVADLPDGGSHLFGVGVRRVAAVEALADDAVSHLDRAADDGQRVKQAVVRRNAQRAAVGVGVQRVQHVQVGLLLRGADAALEQAVDDQADGVDRALGHGGVAALAPAADDGGTALPCLEGHALGLSIL